MAPPYVSISAGVRGPFRELLSPTVLSVVRISSPASTRVAGEAFGNTTCMKAWAGALRHAFTSRASGRIAIERCRVVERYAHCGLLTFRTEKGKTQEAQALKWRFLSVLENAYAIARSSGAIRRSLRPEQNRGLVRKVLVQRPNTDTSLLGHSRHGEAVRALFRQNLNRRL